MSFPKKITDSVYAVGVTNPNLRIFDIVMETKYGTSYNAYLIKGEKNALVETVHIRFFEEYLENLKELIDLSKIDYLILNHTEPDHTGSVAKLLELCPNLTLVGSAAGLKYTAKISNHPFQSKVVKTGDTLDLGGGKVLSFISSPMLHWPDSMFTWLEAEKVMFTCDFLGAHYCEPRTLDTHISYPEQYADAFHYYYLAIFSPFKPHVLAGLEKLKGYDMDYACTSHGPVLTRSRIQEAMEEYRQWSTPAPKGDRRKAAILYVSAYGATEELAHIAARKLEEAGVEVEMVDIIKSDMGTIKGMIDACDGLLVGTCTINRDAPKPVWDALSMIDAIHNRGKKAAVFGSYGWSGEACGMVKSRLEGLGLTVSQEPYRANFIPSDQEKAGMEQFISDFTQTL